MTEAGGANDLMNGRAYAPLARRRRIPAETSVTTSPTGNGSRNVTAAFVNELSYIAFLFAISFFFAAIGASRS